MPRRLALFTPAFECAEEVGLVRSNTAAAAVPDVLEAVAIEYGRTVLIAG